MKAEYTFKHKILCLISLYLNNLRILISVFEVSGNTLFVRNHVIKQVLTMY